MTVRGCTFRCSSIQSPSANSNGPSEYTLSQPMMRTKKSSASSRSGTVKPMCSVPRRPGSPMVVASLLTKTCSRQDCFARLRLYSLPREKTTLADCLPRNWLQLNPISTYAGRQRRMQRSVARQVNEDEVTMPEVQRLDPAQPWVQLSTTAEDWKAADPALLATMLGQLHLIRAFEETVLELAGEGLVHGPAHSSIGQEGGAVGSIMGMRSTDAVNGSHRGHHQFLAKAITHVSGGTLDPGALVTPELQTVLQRTLAEILGLAQGFCRGRGGSMHLQWFEAGALGTNAIVGGGVPLAAGNAWAQKHSDTTDITMSYFGDGAVNIGSVLETMNLAAAWKLPLAFFIENNFYAVSTHVGEATAETRLSARALGFGIPSWRVDGMDPLAVYLATQQAEEVMRSGEGPAVIEAEVYRFFHQNGPYPGSAFGYRSKEEEAEWRSRDPLSRVASEMQKLGYISEDEVAAVRAQAQDAMRAAAGELLEDDPDAAGKRRIIASLWPDPSFVDVGLRGDASELETARVLDPLEYDGELEETRFVDAVASVMGRRMEQDERVVVLGEDVHRPAGGTNGATKGLSKAYPDRVLGTPISEHAFAGLGGGT